MKKRIVSVMLTVLAVLLLAACGKKETPPAPTATPTPAPVSTPSPTPRPTPVLQTPNPTPPPLQTPNPTPSPAPLSTPSPTPMPLSTVAPTPTPALTQLSAGPAGPVITKHPNGEAHYVGESAVFSADAREWGSAKWTAVSPSGRVITMETFRDTFENASVTGEDETTLTITNLSIDMSGWSFFCTFENSEGSTKTESARLRVQENSGGSGSSGGKSKRLHCPGCGSEVPRDLLNCPYCGAEIYGANKYGSVELNSNGDIFYMDNTGVMYYDKAERKSTYIDYNTNYAIFNDSGLVQSGNYNKEEEKRKEEETLNAILAGSYEPIDTEAILNALG